MVEFTVSGPLFPVETVHKLSPSKLAFLCLNTCENLVWGRFLGGIFDSPQGPAQPPPFRVDA